MVTGQGVNKGSFVAKVCGRELYKFFVHQVAIHHCHLLLARKSFFHHFRVFLEKDMRLQARQQYSSIAYLGMTPAVSASFRLSRTYGVAPRLNAATNSQKTRAGLHFDNHHGCLECTGDANQIQRPIIFVIFFSYSCYYYYYYYYCWKKYSQSFSSCSLGQPSSNSLTAQRPR